jgi:hypothetical protein
MEFEYNRASAERHLDKDSAFNRSTVANRRPEARPPRGIDSGPLEVKRYGCGKLYIFGGSVWSDRHGSEHFPVESGVSSQVCVGGCRDRDRRGRLVEANAAIEILALGTPWRIRG